MFKGKLKKLAALVVTAAMTLSMSSTVFAADWQTEDAALSVAAKDGATYEAYQVMTSKYMENNGEKVYTYEVSDDFKGFFNGSPYSLSGDNEIMKDGVAVAGDGRWTNTNATEAAALAQALEQYALGKGISGTKLDATLPIGYYVVAETETSEKNAIASKPILVDLRGATTVTPKDDDIPLEKKIVEENGLVDANNVSIGDTIKYQVTSEVPTYEANVDKDKLKYVFNDTFTNIDFDKDSMVVKVGETTLTEGVDYTLDAETNKFELSFATDTILNNQGKAVTLEYAGVLNKDANVDSEDGNPNHIELTYTNNPNADKSEGKLEDDVVTYTYGFKIRKVDKNDDTKDMAGAKFTIKDSEGVVIGSFEYGVDGEITNTKGVITLEGNYATIKGVDAGTYTITEEKAPDGYAVLGSGVEIKIKDEGTTEPTGVATVKVVTNNASIEKDGQQVSEITENGDGTIDAVVRIENVRGISLPETGSTTMLFCLAGGAAAIVLGALYFAMTRKMRRMD
ncbi:MAG: isopeptide-forming domain-containing fimbrial protein [Lachnospiraceae bacterium]|nr:isopeptide-forming domain-containing fimbrial protein [Lachnospiraceae bacterium]